MQLIEIPAALQLSASEWRLLEGFLFFFRSETFERIAYLCHIEEEQAATLLPALVQKGLIRSEKIGKKTWYSLALTVDLLKGITFINKERGEFEIKIVDRLLNLKVHPFITVTGSRELQGGPLVIPEIKHYCTTVLPSLEVNIGSCCNFNCLYCCVGHEKKYVRPIKEITDDLLYGRKNNLEKVSFSGGEPTIHPELFTMVTIAKDLGYREIFVATNGAMFVYPRYLEKLIQCGVTGIGISFDVPDKQLSEKMWRSASYDSVVEGLERVLQYPSIPLKVWTTVTEMNYRYLPEVAAYLVKAGRRSKSRIYPFLEIVCPAENAWINRKTIVPRFKDVIPFVREALRICHAAHIPMTFGSFPLCFFNGLEKYCMELHALPFRLYKTPAGPVFDRILLDMHQRVKAPGCRQCVFYRECPGLSRGYVDLYGMDELTPVRREHS